jgi:hypothetical protein
MGALEDVADLPRGFDHPVLIDLNVAVLVHIQHIEIAVFWYHAPEPI